MVFHCQADNHTDWESMRVIDTIATGKNINRLRLEAGLTVAQLQEMLGLEVPQAIYRWQEGYTVPSVDNLVLLADIFGVSIDEIVVRREV